MILPSDTNLFVVKAVHDTEDCSGTPLSVRFDRAGDDNSTSACTSDFGGASCVAANIFSSSGSSSEAVSLYNHTYCTEDRFTELQSLFGSVDFVAYESYSCKCTNYCYDQTNAFLATSTCQPLSQSSSAIATVEGDGAVSVQIFTTADCSGDSLDLTRSPSEVVFPTCQDKAVVYTAVNGTIPVRSNSTVGVFFHSEASRTRSSLESIRFELFDWCYANATDDKEFVADDGSSFYVSKRCLSNQYEVAAAEYGSRAFVAQEDFRFDQCSKYQSTFTFLADGACHPTQEVRNESAMGSINDNGSVSIDYYSTGLLCDKTSKGFRITRDEIFNQSCTASSDGKHEVYSSIYHVRALYSSGNCNGAPHSVYLEADPECADTIGFSTSSCRDSMTETCVMEVDTYLSDTFKENEYIAFDSYSSSECQQYSATYAVQATGKCIAGYNNVSFLASSSDNSIAMNIYNGTSKCSGSPQLTRSLSASSLDSSNRTCINAMNIELYTADSSGGSSSSSTAGSNGASHVSTAAMIGIALGAVGIAVLCALFVWSRLAQRQKQDRQLGESEGWWQDPELSSVRLPREKLNVDRMISRGGFGEVYVGRYEGQRVAIKMLLPSKRRDLKHVRAFISEIKLMSTLDHPHIVQFIGVGWTTLTDLCVVTEFMVGGDLRQLLATYERSHKPVGFTLEKVNIAFGVIHALTYLHSLSTPVIHRDIKSMNVLLSEQLDAKLTDFGIARERDESTMTAGVGTFQWIAPEILVGGHYDDKADMFSFGVVLSELDVHSLPYSSARQSMSEATILNLVLNGALTVDFSSASPTASPESTELHESVVALGRKCVQLDPQSRPSAAEALYVLNTLMKHVLVGIDS